VGPKQKYNRHNFASYCMFKVPMKLCKCNPHFEYSRNRKEQFYNLQGKTTSDFLSNQEGDIV
jgi:hypothetical protein